MGIIYLHTNKLNGKVYVGQTWDSIDFRWQSHVSHARRRHRKTHFARAILKYGPESFDHSVVAEADTQEKLDNLEKVWITVLRSADPKCGYNLREGGSRGKHSESSKAKMSEAHKARIRPASRWKPFSKGNKLCEGRTPSTRTLQKLSLATKAQFSTPEARQKLSETDLTGVFCTR